MDILTKAYTICGLLIYTSLLITIFKFIKKHTIKQLGGSNKTLKHVQDDSTDFWSRKYSYFKIQYGDLAITNEAILFHLYQ